MISFRTMKIEQFEDDVYYRAACSCGNSEHDVTIEFEKDEDGDINLFFHKKVCYTSRWTANNIFSDFWLRLKGALKLLFTGYIELEESFMLEKGEHIDSFIKALEEGREELK